MTARQEQVVAALAWGLAVEQATRKIGIVRATAELHLACVPKRAGCLLTAELGAQAVRAGRLRAGRPPQKPVESAL